METIFLGLMIVILILVFTIDTIQKRRDFLNEGKQK
jgi:hypothetical protein